jgi:hypothetical protein
MAHTPLTKSLEPVEAALQRLHERGVSAEAPQTGQVLVDPDVVAVLEGLTDVVRVLAQGKWTDA